MPDHRGRIQLTFCLDNPEERAAFALLQEAPQRGKTKFVVRCLLAQQENKEEQIAQRVVEKLSALFEKGKLPFATVQRKRGRPPKKEIKPTAEEGNAPKPKRQKPARVQRTKEDIPSKPSGISIVPSVSISPPSSSPTQIEQEAFSTVAFKTKEPEQSNQKGFELDDSILKSMENFINFSG